MESSEIYSSVILEKYFNEFRRLHYGKTSFKKGKSRIGQQTVISLFDSDVRSYSILVNETDQLLYNMVLEVIRNLVQLYCENMQMIGIKRSEAYEYLDIDERGFLCEPSLTNKKRLVQIIIDKTGREGTLYVFKDYGFCFGLPSSLLANLKKKFDTEKHCYISIVEEDAYRAYMDHNDNEDDPSRGTDDYSLSWFFDKFFPEGEYFLFKKYLCDFERKVKNEFGLSLVKSLNPNAMFNFQTEVHETIGDLNIPLKVNENRIPGSQRTILRNHYSKNERFRVLTGNSDFAKCFLTSEWMFKTLYESPNVDLTSIVFGYYKSIEQFLFAYLQIHTTEKDGKHRNIFCEKAQGLIGLNDSLFSDKEQSERLSMRALASVLGFYKPTDSGPFYERRNRDLLYKDIDGKTYDYLLEVLSETVEIRNNFFHKYNVETWEKAVQLRNQALTTYYLLLGAYEITDEDLAHFGVNAETLRDDFMKLCDYLERPINTDAKDLRCLELPIYYIDDSEDALTYQRSVNHEYDEYYQPIYNSIKFKKVPECYKPDRLRGLGLIDKGDEIVFYKDNLPHTIWRGVLKKIPSDHPKYTLSGPQEKIFDNGQYLE